MDKTPIQELIQMFKSFETVAKIDKKLPNGMSYKEILYVLDSRLQKEKQFIGEVWDAAATRITNGFTNTLRKDSVPDKQQFLSQYYPDTK